MNDKPTLEQVLIDRGAMLRHVEKSAALLAATGTDWCGYRDRLLAVPTELPDGGIVFLLGERGRGKTQMAVCAMRSMAQRMHPVTRKVWSVRYISAAEMFMGFRDAIKQGREVATLKDLAEPLLLIIDDIHEQAGTDHESRSLTRLLDDRLGNKRWTVLVTNTKRADLGAAVGPSIAHRFHEAGVVIEVEGKNYREAQR